MSPYQLTWITENLAAGRAPMSYAEFDEVKASGINAIVNLCAEFSDLHELETLAGFEVFYLPCWDEETPEPGDMEKALAWLDEAIYLGKKILIHCRHGFGRTGTFITAYMIRRGVGLKAANKKLKAIKAMPSSYGQWKLLKKYNKQTCVLTIREPSLELKPKVNLSDYFSDYEALIKKIDQQVENQKKNSLIIWPHKECRCSHEEFDIQLVEAIYLHSKVNEHFTSHQRRSLIERAAATKNNAMPCPFYNNLECEIYNRKPARCRLCGVTGLSKDEQDIYENLFELSQAVFLALSGDLMPDTEFKFSIADTVSGKFIHKYFHYLSGIQKK